MPHDIAGKIAEKLTIDELTKLRSMRDRIARALPVCDDAEKCGANVAGQRQALQMMDQQFEEIQKRFMPSIAGTPDDD